MKIRTVYFKVPNMDLAISFWEAFLKTAPHKRSQWWSELRCETINFGLLQMEDFKTGSEGNFVPVFEVADAELENTKTRALQAGAKVVVDINEHPDKKVMSFPIRLGTNLRLRNFMGDESITDFRLQPYRKSQLEQVLDFSIQNPVRPFYPRTLLKKFITQLTSSASFIYDVYQDSSRVAVGVLLDKVNNPSGSANLEIIGKVGSISDDELFNFIFSNLPKEISVQVGSHETLTPPVKLLERFGFHFYTIPLK